MSDTFKGIVEALSCKENPNNPGKFGKYRIGMKFNDTWYSFTGDDEASALGLEKGSLVTFEYSVNGNFHNVKKSSLKVSKPAEKPNTPTSNSKAAYVSSNGLAGVKVGHALNNAINIAIAKGDLTPGYIYSTAVNILLLSKRLEENFDSVMSGSLKTREKPQPEPQPEPEPEPIEEEEVPQQEEEVVAWSDDIPF